MNGAILSAADCHHSSSKTRFSRPTSTQNSSYPPLRLRGYSLPASACSAERGVENPDRQTRTQREPDPALYSSSAANVSVPAETRHSALRCEGKAPVCASERILTHKLGTLPRDKQADFCLKADKAEATKYLTKKERIRYSRASMTNS